jgi:cardiolipin synthase A/B
VTDAPSSAPTHGPPLFAVGPDRVRLLRDGREAFPAMLDAIRSAKEEILLEIYWFASDRTGLAFRDALLERAWAGVKVRLLFDAIGSLGTPRANWEPLIEAGAEVYEFAPVSLLWRRFGARRIALRDHRKILVVDGEKGFAAGINLGDEWSPKEAGGEDWRDDAVEIRGPAVAQLRTLFFETWRRCGRSSPTDVQPMPPARAAGVIVLANRIARGRRRRINRVTLSAIHRAERKIDIANAYFLPRRGLLAALRNACRRGAEVRILIGEHSDVLVASLAMRWLVGKLLGYGCRVFVLGGRVLHAKTAVFDETMAMVGSANLDTRSWKYNLECNVAVYDAHFARVVRASFERDLANATMLSLADWQKQGPVHRLLGRLSYAMRHLM